MLKQITLSIFFLFSISFLYSQSENKYYEVNRDNINLRAEPNSNAQVMNKLSKNQLVELIKLNDDWAYVALKATSGDSIKGYVKSKYLVQTSQSISTEKKSTTPNSETSPILKYSILCFLLISFICYIIAMIKVRNHSMVAIANWYDFALLVFPYIAIILALIMWYNDNSFITILMLVLGGLSFCGSIAYSIWANQGNTINILISIFAKVFVMLIIILSVLYIFRGKNKENSWYQDMNHDAKTVAAIGIAGFLIFSLVGHGQHDQIVENLKDKV